MTTKRVSVKDAATTILSKLDSFETMPIGELADKIIATKGVKLEGKTPKATIRKTLDRSPDFVRPKPGMYRLDGLTKNLEQRKDDGETDESVQGDEFDVDLKEAAKAADQKAKATTRKRAAAKPDPKPTGRKRQKANA